MNDKSRTPVALVTGASRGIGKGIAIALAQAGFRVFATGRSIDQTGLPAEIRRIRCDHTQDDQTPAAFDTIQREAGRLDLLVNSAWGGYERMSENGKFTWPAPFWEQPLFRWQAMMDAGVRAAFVCSAHAARLMISQRRGLIVNISFWAAQKHIGNVIYGVSKAATDKLTSDMAHELRAFGVAAVSLYPGLVRTEAVLAAGPALDLSNGETPEFIGRVIAGLFQQPNLMDQTGRVLIAASVAAELGITDKDGKRPRAISLADL